MRILVVDDHELVRKGICSVLVSDPSFILCGEAKDGLDAIDKARALHPDVVVMDISMPSLNGLEATREIKRFLPEAEVVIVSQHETPEMMRQALSAGAHGYVVKSAISTELLSAINKIKKRAPASIDAGTTADAKQSPATIASPPPRPPTPVRTNASFEEALRESEERFRAAMNNMAEGLYTVDTLGLVTYLNPAAETMLGWSSDELVGRKMHDITHHTHPDGRPYPASDCPGLRVMEKGIVLREHEDMFIRKNGAFFPVVLSSSPLKIGGETRGVVVSFRDDTDRRRTEGALRQSERTLQDRVSERTRELEVATSKLRELSARLLQAQDEERRRIARELHDGIGQLLVAMNMNFTRITPEIATLTADAQQAVTENLSLIDQASKEIRTMSHLLHPPLLDEIGLESALRWYLDGFAERSKIAVKMQLAAGFSDGLPRDLNLSLFRIVQESLTNIHRHSQSETAFLSIERTGNEIVLRVTDQGKGIAPEIHAKIASGESSGVGLSGMRERIRQFGGRLDINSDDRGTRLTAMLPIPQAASSGAQEHLEQAEPGRAAAENSAEPIGDPSAGTLNILCVDDEPSGLLSRKLLLESAGYRVLEARSGAEGVKLFQSSRVDAVILDYWMAGMKGTEVAAEMKRINPAVPIIVLSGMLELPGEASGLVDQWLIKGTHRAEQLLDSVSALLARRTA